LNRLKIRCDLFAVQIHQVGVVIEGFVCAIIEAEAFKNECAKIWLEVAIFDAHLAEGVEEFSDLEFFADEASARSTFTGSFNGRFFERTVFIKYAFTN